MRAFEIYDATKRRRLSCATLFCSDGDAGEMGPWRIEINPVMKPGDLPLLLALFAERGEYTVPDAWARRWVDERVPPPGRQNIGEILRANELEE